jgi:uncharacterized protein YerC
MERRPPPADLVSIERALLALENPEEARCLLAALLSAGETEKLHKRWCAYQLRAGGMTLAEIVRNAHVSMTTASRVAALRSTPHRQILDAMIERAAAAGNLEAAD